MTKTEQLNAYATTEIASFLMKVDTEMSNDRANDIAKRIAIDLIGMMRD